MAKQTRRHFKAADKVAILKRHLVEKAEISEVCDEYKIHPTQFYDWQKQFFENGAKAFEAEERGEKARLEAEIDRLNGKLQRKDSIMVELMEHHMALKKSLGED